MSGAPSAPKTSALTGLPTPTVRLSAQLPVEPSQPSIRASKLHSKHTSSYNKDGTLSNGGEIKAEEVEQMLKDSARKDSNDGSDHSSTTSSEILAVAAKAAEHAEEFVRNVWRQGWRVVSHDHLPRWLKDNDYLVRGHRPQLNSFLACFKSIFRIHTETGNIWTHLLAFIALIAVAVMFVSRPSIEVQWQDKCVFLAFLAGAILCMGFSWVFHTVCCHSEKVGKLFNKLDYCGIALLTMGSFVPWLYYSFYCRFHSKVVYMSMTTILGTACIVISLWDRFSEPRFRALRAGLFIAFGLSGTIPAIHYMITDGVYEAFNKAAMGWLILMAFLYISGACIYSLRIPERIFPGKFDIWFQSHQIFHTFVVAAAFVHYHGISVIATYRLSLGDCMVPADY